MMAMDGKPIPPMKAIIENLLKLQTFQFGGPTDAAKKKQMEELRAKIPEPILAHYDRLAVRGKKGVAGVRNQVCTGCHVQVPRATVVTLMHDADIQVCESSGRYLYLLPETAEPPTKAKRVKKAAKTGETELLAA